MVLVGRYEIGLRRVRCINLSDILQLGGVLSFTRARRTSFDSLPRGRGNGKNLGIWIDCENRILLHGDNFVVDAFTLLRKRDDFGARSEVGITLKFTTDGPIGDTSVVVIDIDEMEQSGSAIDMTKKGVLSPLPSAAPSIKTRNVGDKEVLVVNCRDA